MRLTYAIALPVAFALAACGAPPSSDSTESSLSGSVLPLAGHVIPAAPPACTLQPPSIPNAANMSVVQIPPIVYPDGTVEVCFKASDGVKTVDIYALNAQEADPNQPWTGTTAEQGVPVSASPQILKVQAGTWYEFIVCPSGIADPRTNLTCGEESIVVKGPSTPPVTYPAPTIWNVNPSPYSVTVSWYSSTSYDKYLIWRTQDGVPIQQVDVPTGGTRGSWTVPALPGHDYGFQVKGGVSAIPSPIYSDWSAVSSTRTPGVLVPLKQANQSFQALTDQQVLVLGADRKLWLENAPFGSVPPQRQQVDGNVEAFQGVSSLQIYVLGTDGKLWLENAPFGAVPPQRQEVDANVGDFQAVDAQTIFVRGNDGNMWLEHAPFGNVPPRREQVDGQVLAFEAIDSETVMVLGSDGKLWLENAPFGNVPPQRVQIDANVGAFHHIQSSSDVLVLGTDGNLWLEHPPFGQQVPPQREQVDGNVKWFRPMASNNWIWVLGTDGKLWLEAGPFGKVPPSRQQIDANVSGFQPLGLPESLVLGTDGNLWMEHAPFGQQVPPRREQVDGNVRSDVWSF